MNDGQYTNLRNYLEEIANQGKQIIAGQQRTNELLERGPLIVYVNGDTDPHEIAAQVKMAMAQTPEEIASAPVDKPKPATKKGK